jgi:hypothetical protein
MRHAAGHSLRFIFLLAILLLPGKAQAHSGLPFPVLLDAALDPYTVSIWADPDVGTAKFIIEGSVEPALQPVDLRVYLQVRRLDGLPARSDGVIYTAAEHSRTETGAERFMVRLPFEAEVYWQVDVTLDSAAGPVTTRFNLEATPPGLKSLELFLVFAPFALVLVLWWLVVRRAPPKIDH